MTKMPPIAMPTARAKSSTRTTTSRSRPIDLLSLVVAFNSRDALCEACEAREAADDQTGKSWFTDIDAPARPDWNLSAGRHRPQSCAQVKHRDLL